MKLKTITFFSSLAILINIANAQGPIYSMNDQTVTDCAGTLYDSGGDTSNYGNNENKTFTISPVGAQQVKVLISEWDLMEGDYISFYDGTSINDPLIASYSSFLGLIEINGNGGAVTIQLISDTIDTGMGFKMNWQAVGGSCSIGTTTPAPVADFSSPSTSGYRPFFAKLYDNSQNNPVGWTWLLPGADKTRMYEKNVTALYDQPGTYDVSLIVVNEGGRDTITKHNFITVTETPAEIYMFSGTVTKCKGNLYDDGGIEANYQNNKDYILVIKPFGATSVTINFSEWLVEKNYDVLKIYNGTSISAPLLGKWTSTSPGTVTANSGAMTLRFTSDKSINKSGWKASWSSIGGNCGTPPPIVNFSANTRTITVGGSVNFTDQSTNSPSSWNWDFEEGSPSTSNYQNPAVTYSTTGTFSVSLSSSNAGGMGSIIKNGYITVLPDSNITISMKSGKETSCNGTLYDDGGVNGKYQNNKTYTLVIQPPGATSITMHFIQWLVENNYDFLKIYDGTSINDPLLGSWSGISPGTVTANNGAMTLKFTSDQYVNATGWKATWATKGGDCGPAILDQIYSYKNNGSVGDEHEFMVYPNPASNEFTLKMNKLYKQVCIIDLTGRTILKLPIHENEMKIQLPEHTAGLYFIQLKGDFNIKTQKLIVQ